MQNGMRTHAYCKRKKSIQIISIIILLVVILPNTSRINTNDNGVKRYDINVVNTKF